MKCSPFSTIRSHSFLTNLLLLAIVCSTLYLLGAALLQLSTWVLCLGALLILLVILGPWVLIQNRHRDYAAALATLSEEQLATLAARAERCVFPSRKVLFRQDAPADRLYLIVRGEVEVLRRDGDGIYAPIALVGAGDWLGEVGLLGRTTRRVAAKATTEVEALVIDRAAIATILAVANGNPVSYHCQSAEIAPLLRIPQPNDTVAKLKLLRDAFQHIERNAAPWFLGSPFAQLPYTANAERSTDIALRPIAATYSNPT